MKNRKIIEEYLGLESHPMLGNHALINNRPYVTYIAEANTLDELWAKVFDQLPLCTVGRTITWGEYLIYWRTNPTIHFKDGIFTMRFRMALCEKTNDNISHSPLDQLK